jgi:inner membrane protein
MSWRNDQAIHRAPWRILGGLRAESAPVASNMDHPIVRHAISENATLRRFLYWSIMPVARVTRDGCIATVEVADARYSLPGEGLRGPGVPDTRLDLCAQGDRPLAKARGRAD